MSYNTNGIHVDPAAMELRGKNTLNLAEELKNQIDSLNNNKENLMGIWNGDAATSFDTVVQTQVKNLDNFKLLIEEMGNKIITGATTFHENEQENADEAKKLFNEVDV